MRRKFTTFIAAALLATIPLASMTTQADASSKWVKRGFATGVGVGIGLGIANALTPQRQVIVQQPAPVYVQPAPVYVQPAPVYVQPAPVYSGGQFSQAHYDYCFTIAPNSYNPNTNTYVKRTGQVVNCYSGR